MAAAMEAAAVTDLAAATDSAAVMDSAAQAVDPTAEVMDTIVEVMETTAVAMDITVDAMDTMAETIGGMATTADTMDTTGIVDTTGITAAGRRSTGLVGGIRGTPWVGTLDIPIMGPITIRIMATRLGATMAAITVALITAIVMPPVQEWPSCNADFRGPGITQVLSTESWDLRRGEQFALTNAIVSTEVVGI